MFLFTKKAHTATLTAALIAAAFTAGFKTVLAIILGKVFDVIAGFANGTLDRADTLSDISMWSLVLLGLGIGNCIASTIFLALWVTFGELQAASVRNDIFASLLSKEMAWFDAQNEGISSLLVRIQT